MFRLAKKFIPAVSKTLARPTGQNNTCVLLLIQHQKRLSSSGKQQDFFMVNLLRRALSTTVISLFAICNTVTFANTHFFFK